MVFHQLPSAHRNIPPKEWRHLSKGVGPAVYDLEIDQSQDLLVGLGLWLDDDTNRFELRLQSCSTGQPHPLAAHPVLDGEILDFDDGWISKMEVLHDHVGVIFFHPDDVDAARGSLFIWDWKTPILEIAMCDHGLSSFTFLNERLLLLAVSNFHHAQMIALNYMTIDLDNDSSFYTVNDVLPYSIASFNLPECSHHSVYCNIRIVHHPLSIHTPSPEDLQVPFRRCPQNVMLVIVSTISDPQLDVSNLVYACHLIYVNSRVMQENLHSCMNALRIPGSASVGGSPDQVQHVSACPRPLRIPWEDWQRYAHITPGKPCRWHENLSACSVSGSRYALPVPNPSGGYMLAIFDSDVRPAQKARAEGPDGVSLALQTGVIEEPNPWDQRITSGWLQGPPVTLILDDVVAANNEIVLTEDAIIINPPYPKSGRILSF